MSEPFASLASQERAALLGLVARVDAGSWDRPTPCPGWSVKDVLGHLVEGELACGSLYRGETATLEATSSEPGVERWRPLPGPAVRQALWQHGSAAQRIADALSDADWGRRAQIRFDGGRPPLDVSLRTIVRVQYLELAVHGHDVATAMGAPPVWGERAGALAGLVVRRSAASLASRLAPGPGLEVSVDGASWTIEAREGTWSVREGRHGGAAHLAADAETVVLAAYGRITTGEALARATVEGDEPVARAILENWRLG